MEMRDSAEYSHGCKSSLFFKSSIDYQDIQALGLQWNPCGENSIKPATECTQSKKEGKEQRGREEVGGRTFLLNNKAPDLKLDCTITALIPGNPDGEPNT